MNSFILERNKEFFSLFFNVFFDLLKQKKISIVHGDDGDLYLRFNFMTVFNTIRSMTDRYPEIKHPGMMRTYLKELFQINTKKASIKNWSTSCYEISLTEIREHTDIVFKLG